MKNIILTKGKVAIVDNNDYRRLSKLSWYASKEKNGLWYAKAYIKIKKKKYFAVRMHRFILKLNISDKRQIDHINHNGLDNRRCNLRIGTNAQNSMNRRKSKGYTSRFKGVFWNKNRSKWVASIWLNYKCYYLGCYDDEVEAAKEYNRKAKRFFRKFALLNKLGPSIGGGYKRVG